ncbi:MAG: sugar phosphate isomerase/epimerase family protein [Kiritimatiellia bacterium]
MNRRTFLKTATFATAGFSAAGAFAASEIHPKGVGMCDWTMGCMAKPECFAKAEKAGLSGVQVSVGGSPNSIPLRNADVCKQYLELSKKHNITIHSVAAGGILNKIPLKSEPQSAIYVLDAIEAARALGANNILMAFFGKGDLRRKGEDGKPFNDLKEGEFSSYELDEQGVTRVVEVLRQIVPRAEDAGIILGLENTLSAKQNVEIIERVGSPMVQVYYDMGNSTYFGYDVPTEIRMLGKERICEMHIKDKGCTVFSTGKGQVDMLAVAKALKDIRYRKWMCLENGGRKNRFFKDVRDNIAYSKKTFSIR